MDKISVPVSAIAMIAGVFMTGQLVQSPAFEASGREPLDISFQTTLSERNTGETDGAAGRARHTHDIGEAVGFEIDTVLRDEPVTTGPDEVPPLRDAVLGVDLIPGPMRQDGRHSYTIRVSETSSNPDRHTLD